MFWGHHDNTLGHPGIGTFGLTLRALGGSLEPPWGTLRPRPQKTTKELLFGTSFWTTFCFVFSSLEGMFLKCVFGRPVDHMFNVFLLIFGHSLGWFL